MEGLIEPQWWSREPSENLFRPRPLEGRKAPLSKKTLLLYILAYLQQIGAENISVDNAMFVISFRTFRTILKKVEGGGAIAPASPMAARYLYEIHCSYETFTFVFK